MLYSWRGYTDQNYPFRYLGPSFRTAYENSIQKHGSLLFLKVLTADGRTIEKTFAEFDRDVGAVFMTENWSQSPVPGILTLSGNTYENLVYITAALLSGKIVCPLNGNEISEKLEARLRELSAFQVYADRGELKRETRSMRLPERPVGECLYPTRDPSQPMIYIFTSGTTGDSKIVQQREIGLMVNIDSLIGLHRLHERRRLATCMPVFHVNALEFSFLGCLLSGSELVLFEKFEFFQFFENIKKCEVEIVSLIPSILRSMLAQKDRINKAGLRLDYVVTAASYLAPTLAVEACQAFSFKLIQGYGLSEAINFSLKIPPKLSHDRVKHWLTAFPTPSLGTPLDGNEVVILDQAAQPLGPDQVGEIAVRGLNVMTGYRGGKGQEFKNNYLLTGDLGYFKICEESGQTYFFITGRKKDIIKRYGETVSLKEVDDAILPHLPAEVVAVAVGFPNETAGEEIGLVVFGKIDLSVLATKLQALPDALRPRILLAIESRPLTESGKPKRWIHTKLFESHQKTVFGKKVLF